VGIFIDKKYQTQAIPEPYLRAVVYHEVGHWRDPVVWLSLPVIPLMFLMLYLLALTGNLKFLLVIYGLMAGGYFVGIWKERRADAYARRHMADYDEYDKPFVPDKTKTKTKTD
jgi:Zn-dependent protease with chaperone function